MTAGAVRLQSSGEVDPVGASGPAEGPPVRGAGLQESDQGRVRRPAGTRQARPARRRRPTLQVRDRRQRRQRCRAPGHAAVQPLSLGAHHRRLRHGVLLQQLAVRRRHRLRRILRMTSVSAADGGRSLLSSGGSGVFFFLFYLGGGHWGGDTFIWGHTTNTFALNYRVCNCLYQIINT